MGYKLPRIQSFVQGRAAVTTPVSYRLQWSCFILIGALSFLASYSPQASWEISRFASMLAFELFHVNLNRGEGTGLPASNKEGLRLVLPVPEKGQGWDEMMHGELGVAGELG
ncbi:hypothetical protein VTL71DRAFT_10408 [Oculimacula yallundae]|uniref:Uncharacterized protein n=1 Tax=Oculimacula yallundae TaxID=86028 RepID=A0ABR4CVI1_9HELO